ncbi:hypothetical protein PGIGA_G00117980 [Pangasianodon gigas]|uniref:Uncharacterized protein n=1 Tax=Pangasianodon gigas TaxID=30993 RepID=A0ACC5XFF0_PANGG|nr:hypothetical protein [Pangasianodon gigas]
MKSARTRCLSQSAVLRHHVGPAGFTERIMQPESPTSGPTSGSGVTWLPTSVGGCKTDPEARWINVFNTWLSKVVKQTTA